MPNYQVEFQKIICEIPFLNFSDSLNYDFNLSYYDKHYFKIDKDFTKPILMYFFLNEILVYTGNEIEKDAEKKIYLGKSHILIKWQNHHDLLRNYPDENEKLLLTKCLPNKIN